MEESTTTTVAPTTRQIHFLGKGGDLFGILIINMLLTGITLGFYYPWAKASKMQYLYENTELDGSRFQFHGTGQEMFMGYLKAIGLSVVLMGVFSVLYFIGQINLAVAIVNIVIFVVTPIALHGSLRYRMSRTSWRGIHFGYRGELGELIKKFIGGSLLTVLTLGFYSAWFTVDLRKYMIGKIKFGNIALSYKGKGEDNFLINLKGFFLIIFTLGIYYFWFVKEKFNFYVNNIEMEQNGQKTNLRSTATGVDFLGLTIVNFLILIFTLGFGAAWVTVRTLDFVFSHIDIEGYLDTDKIEQTEEEYKDATGDDLANMLSLDIV